MSRAMVAGLAVLCLLAGCGNLAGPTGVATPSETLTPAAVPEPTPAPVEVVPGLGATRVTDERALTAAHRAGLNGTSYELTRQRQVVGPNGTIDLVTVTATVAAGNGYHISRIERSTLGWYTAAPYARLDIWYRDGVVRNRFVRSDREATYWGSNAAQPGGPVTDTTRASFVSDALAAVEYRVANVSQTANGTHYQLVSTGPSGQGISSAPTLLVDARNISLTATVRGDGVVLAYHLRYEATFKNRSVRVMERYTVDDIGEARLTKPDWLRTANETLTG